MKDWVVNGDVLEIFDGEKCLQASTEEVYQSVLEEKSVWPDLPPGRSGAALDIRFSRYPVDLRLVVSVDDVTGKPVLFPVAHTHKGTSFRISATALERGHVVHGEVWYPADPDAVDAVVELMDEVGYTDDGGLPTTLRGLLHLKKMAVEGGPVVDELGNDALKYLLSGQKRGRAPKNIRAQLYRYQCDGWRWLTFVMREQLGGLLADEMGLGKTLQIRS